MYIGYFCGAEGAAKIFLPPIDGGHCPPSNFRRGALPPINFEILGIAPHQKFELSVPGGSPFVFCDRANFPFGKVNHNSFSQNEPLF